MRVDAARLKASSPATDDVPADPRDRIDLFYQHAVDPNAPIEKVEKYERRILHKLRQVSPNQRTVAERDIPV